MKLSVSAVVTASKSALDYYDRYVLGNKDEPTQAQLDGTMVHSLILEPDKFYSSYFTDQEFPKDSVILKLNDELKGFLEDFGIRPKGNKAELIAATRDVIRERNLDRVIIYDDWMEKHTAGKTFVSQKKWTSLHKMRDRVLKHKFVATYLDVGVKEFSLEEEILGHEIRGRVDWFVELPDRIICIDLKKVRSANKRNFLYAIRDGGLGIQAALYTALIKKRFNKDCMWCWCAIQLAPPYHCEVYAPNDADIEGYTVFARQALQRIEIGYEKDYWPGYSDGNVQSIGLEKWEQDQAANIELELEEEQ